MDQKVMENRPAEPAEREQGQTAEKKKKPARGRRALIGLAIAAVLIALIGVGLWWLQARHYESTDDAFVEARFVSISPQVAGAIVDVLVNDNQLVEAGEPLLKIDDRDYRARADEARAQLAQSEGQLATLNAQLDAQQTGIDQARKQLAEADSALSLARRENDRAQNLVKSGAGTVQRADQTAADLTQRQAAFDVAQQGVVAAEKQIPILKAQQQQAEAGRSLSQAAIEQAETNLDRTNVVAPFAGRVTKLTAAKGAYAQPGQNLLMFVPRDVWVTANFKETQLTDMRPGQPVDLEIDTYPDRTFRGHVDSLQAGSGTVFSLLPAENATGNFVKVVQRVPVKIVFDEPPDVFVGPGMSVVPYVRVR
ncbi:HlyD family secretion protein [Mesorhizobium sp. BAC0120]|uniref:HlyD family secretion protein n=1 Tax=Mesorhizobium sp. BAC0120 TaxID=3090670 RepID=UPI00298CC033|nr:HlyD family secretion protein [Mesorhizobium sp. BAC0120]MDW6025454.1 HlyD family secretion protein [Mesorhizobium sp. BAC0120]